jgi:uncharacterized protein (TIGR03435 family)
MHPKVKSKNKLLISAAAVMTVVALGHSDLWNAPARAQVPRETPSAQVEKVPAWQTAAGGKAEFEVASVREDLSGKFHPPPFSMDADDGFTNTGGLFTADLSLQGFIDFAYKLPEQYNLLSHLPDWARKKQFEIQARAPANATKDQMRLMMQSLLAERFKLALHYETQETEVLVMTLAKPGKLGPRLRLHADGPACDAVVPRPPGAPVTFDMFPCNIYMAMNEPDNVTLAGARNTSVESMAAFFSSVGRMRPIVDRTGIKGAIDFSMEYTPEPRGAPAAGGDTEAAVPEATFDQVVKDQLGLKLEPAKLPLEVPVVDHVEMPSEN